MARWQKASWIETLDFLPGLNLEEKARARIIILGKPREDRELYFEGTWTEAAAAIKALLKETAPGSVNGATAARSGQPPTGSPQSRHAWVTPPTGEAAATSTVPAVAATASAPVRAPAPPPSSPGSPFPRASAPAASPTASSPASTRNGTALPAGKSMGAINAAALSRGTAGATSADGAADADAAAAPADATPRGSSMSSATRSHSAAPSALSSSTTSTSRVRWSTDSPSVLGPNALGSPRAHTPALTAITASKPGPPPPPPLGGWLSVSSSGEPPPSPEPSPLVLSILWSRCLGGDSVLAARPSGWWEFASASTSASSSCRPSATEISYHSAPANSSGGGGRGRDCGGGGHSAAEYYANGYAAATDSADVRNGGAGWQPGANYDVLSPFAAPTAYRLACAASAPSSSSSSSASTSRRPPARELLVETAAAVRHLSALPGAFRAAHLRASQPGDVYCRTVRKVVETSGAGRTIQRHARFAMLVDFVEKNTAILIKLRAKEISRRPWKDNVANGGGGTSLQCYRCEVVPDPAESLEVLLKRLDNKKVKVTDLIMWGECPSGWQLWDGVPLETGVKFEKS